MALKESDLFTRLLRTRPLFTAALFFMLGCILSHSLAFSLIAWIAASAVLLFLVLLFRSNRRILCALLVILMLPMGAIRFDLAWNAVSPVSETAGVQITGRITDDPVYNAETERCICVLDNITIDGEKFDGKLRLYLRGDELLLQDVHLAQAIACKASLWQGDTPGNYAEFSFADYLRINKLRGYATAKIEDVQFSVPEYNYADANNLICSRISARIDRLFPQSAAIVKAFVLGDRSEMDDADRKSFSETGAAHLLAISGMHISVLAMFISYLFGRFLSRRNAFLLTLCILLFYGWLIGFSASLLRAVLMFSIYQIAALTGRFSDSPTRLAAAALFHLMISPIDILTAGFILSYCASAGIVLLSRPLSRLFRAEELLYGSIDISPTAMIMRKCARWFMRSIITSLAAMLATFPAVIHFFGAQPVWTLLVNLIAVPLAMLSYIVSIIALLIGFAPVCTAADFLFGLLTGFIRICSALPLSSLRIARFPALLHAFCALIFLLASDLSALPEILRRFLPVCALLAMLFSNGIALINLHTDGFVFMDAGQADCTLLKTDGNVYLFDVGDSYTPAADYLGAMNFGVDALFISHPHADHAGGLASILDICVPDRIYISANYDYIDLDEGIAETIALAESMGSKIITVQTGDVIQLSSKSFAKVLAPDAGIYDHSANEDSLILHVICGEISALFTGDMPAEVMPDDLPDIDILKVAHHGSRNGVDPRTLTGISPSAAVISVGEGNNYGHPAAETVDLLEAAGAMVLRTDLCGAISIGFDRENLEISTYNNFGGLE